MSAPKEALACTYAALLLHDDGIEVTADKIAKVVKAANVSMQPFWPEMFAKMLETKKIDELITAGTGGGAVAVAAAPAGGAAAGGEEKKEEKKEESEEEDVGMGGLFD